MDMTATEFRRNLYKILDRVAEGGEEITIRRKGRKIRIVGERPSLRTSRIVPHDTVAGDINEPYFFDTPWEWNEERNFEDLP